MEKKLSTRKAGARGPNFTEFERQVLIDLVAKRKQTLENNRTDAVSTADKNQAWKEAATEFNATPKVQMRKVDQLRTCYENMKKTSKKNAAAEKVRVYKTGGGDSPAHLSTVDEKILSIIAPRITPLENPFDSDAAYNKEAASGPPIEVDRSKYPDVSFIFPEQELRSAQTDDALVVVPLVSENETAEPMSGAGTAPTEDPPSSSTSKKWNECWSRRRPTQPQKVKGKESAIKGISDLADTKRKYYDRLLQSAEAEHEAKMELLKSKTAYYKSKTQPN